MCVCLCVCVCVCVLHLLDLKIIIISRHHVMSVHVISCPCVRITSDSVSAVCTFVGMPEQVLGWFPLNWFHNL